MNLKNIIKTVILLSVMTASILLSAWTINYIIEVNDYNAKVSIFDMTFGKPEEELASIDELMKEKAYIRETAKAAEEAEKMEQALKDMEDQEAEEDGIAAIGEEIEGIVNMDPQAGAMVDQIKGTVDKIEGEYFEYYVDGRIAIANETDEEKKAIKTKAYEIEMYLNESIWLISDTFNTYLEQGLFNITLDEEMLGLIDSYLERAHAFGETFEGDDMMSSDIGLLMMNVEKFFELTEDGLASFVDAVSILMNTKNSILAIPMFKMEIEQNLMPNLLDAITVYFDIMKILNRIYLM